MGDKGASGNRFSWLFKPTGSETTYMYKREILVVFLIGCLIALSLWLLVNMGKEYTVTLTVPFEITDYGEDMAFTERPPDEITISVSAEGWNLLPLYRNPPIISLSYERGEIRIFDIVQDHMAAYPDMTVQNVEPGVVAVEMEPKISKRVPVVPNIDVRLARQYEIMSEVHVQPDSVTVSGAASIIDTVQHWPTEFLGFRNVRYAVDQRVPLADCDVVCTDTSEVRLFFDITEFTEGEIRIYVRVVGVPAGTEIRFNPSVITVKYHVSIEHFSRAQEMVPYEAFVNYQDIVRDTTGFVVPTVRATNDDLDLRLRSFQPRRVSYFRVIDE